MSVNRKIFGLASSALVFAGMAYGQALTCMAPTTSPTNPIELRAEGATELVSDTITSCAASGVVGGIQGSVTAFISGSGVQGITSKALTGSFAGFTEATLSIIDPSGTNSTVYYPGVVSGAQVNFGTSTTAVTFPNYAFKIQVSNVRVNVTGTYPSVPQAVTETVFAGTQGVASLFTPTAITVGYIRNGLSVQGTGTTIYTGAGSATAGTAGNVFGSGSINNNLPIAFPVCIGIGNSNSNTPGGIAQAFTITVSELFAGAFKTQTATSALTPASANIPGSESGSLIAPTGLPTTVGTANSGTRIKFVFNNIPANVTLSVPVSISTGNLTMVLTTGTETGALTAATATSGYNGGFALTATSGSATAIYEATFANLTVIKSFVLPVYTTFAANVPVVPAGPITVTTSYSPSPATPGAALPATLPTIPYFANTGTVLNGSTYVACQTTLLFPFVTNQSGFETGIAIANTGLDNLSSTGASVATGQSGACVINFYGSTGAEGGTQPTTITTPNFPTATHTPTSTIAKGTTHADTLTDIIGGPFQGYAIAVCPFLYAKGFAFIEFGLATSNGVVEGYVADVINSNRQSAVTSTVAVGNNSPESSGQ
jgi:hypothetical protein